MSNTLCIRSSISRKKEFRTVTVIAENGEERRVVKHTPYKEGLEFLSTIPTKTQALADALGHLPTVKVVPAHLDGPTVWSPFIAGPTLDEEFSEALMRRDQAELKKLFKEVLDIVDALETSVGKPAKLAEEIFGFDTDTETALLNCGYIDFSLDNFIRGSDAVYLIDAEFKYDFGIPKQYIINRLVIVYLARYSYLISSMASESMPILQISDSLFIPTVLWDTYKERFSDLKASQQHEQNFQRYYSYTKGASPNIYPSSEWRTLTRSPFQHAVLQLHSLRKSLENEQRRSSDLSQALHQTNQSLNKYRRHWLIRCLNFVRHSFNKLAKPR